MVSTLFHGRVTKIKFKLTCTVTNFVTVTN